METDGGGWTVLMKRQDGSENFARNWTDYDEGFGDLLNEFWLGLSKMHRLTPDGFNTLRVDLGDFANNKAYAKYRQFEILDAVTEYMLVVNNYTGNAGDSLGYHSLLKFTTKDRDNDERDTNCAIKFPGGGWWFKSCFIVRLTGPYAPDGIPQESYNGVIWDGSLGKGNSLKYADMKMKRNT